MQTLGLSDSTPKPTSRLRDLFWPDLSAEPSAESACDTASWACFAIAGITAIFAFITNPWALLDGLLFLLIGLGLRAKSRPASIAGFLLYVLETIAYISGGRMPGVLTILILAILFNSIRASFAYHRMRKAALAQTAGNQESTTTS
jgi:hypothetical protein